MSGGVLAIGKLPAGTANVLGDFAASSMLSCGDIMLRVLRAAVLADNHRLLCSG